MRSVSFYSYKGGTGRTLLVANVAVLAARLGFRVVMVDLDLEAPGLPYKFPSTFPGGPPQRPGVVEWLTAEPRPSLDDLLHPVVIPSPFHPSGSLHLICAGGKPSREYLRAMRDLQDGVQSPENIINSLIMLRDAIESQVQPDLLLLDSRTGITATNAITNRVLADDVLAITLNNAEQLDGTREVLRSLAPLKRPDEDSPLGLYVVLSRMAGKPEDVGAYELSSTDRGAREAVSDFLTEPAVPLATTLVNPAILLLHNDADVADREEVLLARDRVRTSDALHLDYLRVADALLGSELAERIDAALGAAQDDAQRREWARFFQRADILAELDSRQAVPETWVDTLSTSDQSVAGRVSTLRTIARSDLSRRPELADALVALGRLQNAAGEASKAADSVAEAVQLYEDLVRANAGRDYLPNLITNLDNLADLYFQTGLGADALRTASRAYDLAKSNPDAVPKELLATTMARYGSRLGETGDPQAAARYIQDAINTLIRPNSLRLPVSAWTLHLPKTDVREALARMLGALGMFEMQLGKPKDALRASQRASEMWQTLEAADSGYRQAYASSLSNLGNTFRVLGQYEEAENKLRLASTIFRDLAADDPGNYLDPLASNLVGLAAVYGDLGRHNKAVATAEEALHFRRDLLETDRPEHREGLASALNNVAAQYGSLERYGEAVARAEEAIALLKEGLPSSRSRQAQELLAAALNNFALGSVHLGRLEEALPAALDSVDIYRRLSDADSPWHRAESARALLNVSVIYSRLDRAKEALTAAEQAVEIASRLDRQTSSQYKELYATSLNALSMRQLRNGDYELAIASAEVAAGEFRVLAERQPDRYLPRVAGALEALATGLGAMGNDEGARSVREDAGAIYKRVFRSRHE